MAKQTLPDVEPGISKIRVPYLDGTVVFTHPFVGPDYYTEVARKILENWVTRLSLPNGEKTAFLLHACYVAPENFPEEVREQVAKFQNHPAAIELRDSIMRPGHLWIFQKNLWVPEKYKSAHGVFVFYDSKGKGLTEELDIGELEKALKGGRKLKNGVRFSEDGRVGFAPRNTYRNGKMSPEDFAEDGFIVVSNQEAGAEKLAEVSQLEHFACKRPYSLIVEPCEKLIQTVSAVHDYNGHGLGFLGSHSGGHSGDGDDGYASGVLE